MKPHVNSLAEPELEFGGRQTHVDVRTGLRLFGPVDRDSETAPSDVRVGLIGTTETTSRVRGWLQACAEGVEAKKGKKPNLFQRFPGFSDESSFGANRIFEDRWTEVFTKSEVAELSGLSPLSVVSRSVEAFVERAERLTQKAPLSVLIVAPPPDLLKILDEHGKNPGGAADQPLDDGEDSSGAKGDIPAFHDLLKARGMSIRVPLQMVRPPTYGWKPRREPGGPQLSLQDEATIAWNIFSALYYKAGGGLWRLVRDPAALSSCFAGISFYRSLDHGQLLTSVAQVFNERGEGVVVRGAQAQLSKTDRQVHLDEKDAFELMANAIEVYRQEHRHAPARLVVHKTSRYSEQETAGFSAAARQERVDVVDLVNVRRSFTRLFRHGEFPPLRGTLLHTGTDKGTIYLRGSVPFFEVYPGLYVPRPLEFSVEYAEATTLQIAEEMLGLSKLNWNNTQFDGGEPITVRAARRVGDILKCVPDEEAVLQPGFRFFM